MLNFIILTQRHEVASWLEQILNAREEGLQEQTSHVVFQEPGFYGEFHGDRGFTIVAADDGKLAGFAVVGLKDAISETYSEDIRSLGVSRAVCASNVQVYIRRPWRGRGMGKALGELRNAVSYARGVRHVYFTTHPDNERAHAIAQQMGALELDRRRVYSANVLRVIYRVDLAPPLRELGARHRLCALPSPLEPLPRLSALLGGPEIWIKRDDRIGLGMGGNKSRMLEYIVAEAQEQGAETLVTRGSLYSNHCRQTAAFAAKLGLGCRLVLRGHPPDEPRGNYLLDMLFGARVRFSYDEDPDAVLDDEIRLAEAAGERPHRIQYGGANPIGASSYADALEETLQQGGWFHRIFIAASSGATQAGLVVGCAHHRLSTRVEGISVDEPESLTRERVVGLSRAIAEARGAANVQQIVERVEVTDAYLGGGYAVCGDREREALALFAQQEGILLDPVYTARAAAGMIDWIRAGRVQSNERILFWHTGGLPGLFALPGRTVAARQMRRDVP